MVQSGKGDSKPTFKDQDQEWLRTFYSEVWQQYSHEDDLYLTRSTLFFALQAALIGILTSTVGPLVITKSGFNLLGGGIFGFLACFFAILGLSLAGYWKKMTYAARDYASLRNITARIIEQKSGVQHLGPAEIESLWVDWSQRNAKEIMQDHEKKFKYPTGFQDKYSGSKIEIPPRRYGGFVTHLNTIKLVRFTWYFIFTVGLVIMVISLIFYKIS